MATFVQGSLGVLPFSEQLALKRYKDAMLAPIKMVVRIISACFACFESFEIRHNNGNEKSLHCYHLII